MNMPEALQNYIKAFSNLNVNKARGMFSPHKPVMLLAILELAETGLLKENKIYYTQHLLDLFRSFFQAVQKPGDSCNPYFPFFHLRSEPFWHLKSVPGKEAVVDSLLTVRG